MKATPPWDKVSIITILVATFLNSLWWSSAIPFDGAPDEYVHIKIPQFYVNYHRLPVFLKDPGMARSCRANGIDCGSSYSVYANYGYFVDAFFMAAVPKSLAPQPYQRGRLVSAVMATIFIWLVYLTTRKLFPHDHLRTLVIVLIAATIPMFTFVSAYINSDIAGLVIEAAIFWFCLTVILEKELRPKRVIIGGITVGLLALSRINLYPLFLLFPWAVYLRQKRFGESWKETIGHLSLIGFIGVIVSGWWFIRNWILYQDFIGNRVFWEHWWSFSTRANPQQMGIAPITLLTGQIYGRNWLGTSFDSFIGSFGYMTIWYPGFFYNTVKVLTILAAAGLVTLAINAVSMGFSLARFWLGVAAVGLLTLILSGWTSWANEYQPQGRYLFAMYYPFVVGLTVGLSSLNRSKIWRVSSLTFLLGFWLLANLWGRSLIVAAGGGV